MHGRLQSTYLTIFAHSLLPQPKKNNKMTSNNPVNVFATPLPHAVRLLVSHLLPTIPKTSFLLALPSTTTLHLYGAIHLVHLKIPLAMSHGRTSMTRATRKKRTGRVMSCGMRKVAQSTQLSAGWSQMMECLGRTKSGSALKSGPIWAFCLSSVSSPPLQTRQTPGTPKLRFSNRKIPPVPDPLPLNNPVLGWAMRLPSGENKAFPH